MSQGSCPTILTQSVAQCAQICADGGATIKQSPRLMALSRTREVRRSFLLLDYDDAVRWARTIGGALTSMEAPLAFAAENELELVHEMSRTFHSSNWLNHFHILYFEDVWLEAMRYDWRRLGHSQSARTPHAPHFSSPRPSRRHSGDYDTPWFYFDPSDTASLARMNEFLRRAKDEHKDDGRMFRVGFPGNLWQ